MTHIFEKIGTFLFQKIFESKDLETLPRAKECKTNMDVFSLWNYKSEKTKKLIRHMKNYRSYFLAKHIGDHLYKNSISVIGEHHMFSYFTNPIVIPMPISKKRFRERGFNQTHIYTKQFAKRLGAEYHAHILKRKVSQHKQALIQNKQNRFENVKNCFYIITKKLPLIEGRDIIIVDDLITTGATLNEARKTLEKGGARKIIAITIAH